MWDRRVVGEFALIVSFRNVEDLSSWAFAGVYNPNSVRDRRILCGELAGLLSWWNLPWCVGVILILPFSSVKGGRSSFMPCYDGVL
jgi:hypothetical protein